MKENFLSRLIKFAFFLSDLLNNFKYFTNDIFDKTSFLHGSNATYIEQMYEKYQTDPNQIPEDWKNFFSGLSNFFRSFSSLNKFKSMYFGYNLVILNNNL